MYGQQITTPDQVKNMFSTYNNTSDKFTLQNRIPVTLILEPKAHFKQNSSGEFTPEFKALLGMNTIVPTGATPTTSNTFGQSITLAPGDIYQPNGPSYTYTRYDYTTNPPTGSQITLQSNLTPTQLKIDSIYDVYLDGLTTYNCKSNTGSNATVNKNNMAFILEINDWNIDNFCNLNLITRSITIPNEATTPGTSTTHKSKKLNYLTRLTPDNMTTISGKITNLSGDIIFPSTTDNDSRVIIEMILIPRDKK